MSRSVKKVSEKEQDGQKSDSVYDFLYHDRQRIGSFLAQFDDAGHLQQITQSESASKQARRGYKVSFGGGATVLGTGGQGNLGFERSPSEHGTEAVQRVYDPNWTNALALLDYLQERELVQQDIKTARIGQIILISGELSILNTTLLRKLWEMPMVKAGLPAQVKSAVMMQIANRTAAQSPETGIQTSDAISPETQALIAQAQTKALLSIEILPTLPHGVQASIDGKGYSSWCSLQEEGLVGTVSDISLKHGYSIPGIWYMLGILDALPGSIPSQTQVPLLPYGTVGPHNFAVSAKNFAIVARQAFGRPAGAYGMTPLMIFRQVSN